MGGLDGGSSTVPGAGGGVDDDVEGDEPAVGGGPQRVDLEFAELGDAARSARERRQSGDDLDQVGPR